LRRSLYRAALFEQAAHGVGGLSAVLEPMLGAFVVDLYIGGIGEGIVIAKLLNKAPLRGARESATTRR